VGRRAEGRGHQGKRRGQKAEAEGQSCRDGRGQRGREQRLGQKAEVSGQKSITLLAVSASIALSWYQKAIKSSV
jgi:hypothetical protein